MRLSTQMRNVTRIDRNTLDPDTQKAFYDLVQQFRDEVAFLDEGRYPRSHQEAGNIGFRPGFGLTSPPTQTLGEVEQGIFLCQQQLQEIAKTGS